MEVGPVGSHAVESVAFPSDFKVLAKSGDGVVGLVF